MTPGSDNEPDGRPESDAEWESRPERLTEAREADPIRLMLDLEGFEGPLDVLLVLARDQKVDLMRVSIVALADQYLAFIEAARTNHLDLAVDYLVMAAWLTYLKSRLLLPVQKDDDEPSAEDLAEELARRLRRLEAIRAVAARLMNRPQTGRDIFLRGLPETRQTKLTKVWDDTLYDLLSAYAFHQRRIQTSVLHIEKRTVWSLSEARETLIRLVGEMADWMPLDTFLTPFLQNPEDRTTVLASSFTATLELAREGTLELQQSAAFEPLYIRPKRRKGTAEDEDAPSRTGDESRDG